MNVSLDHELLKTWLKRRDISITEFARKTGYTYVHAWGLVNGSRNITHETLGRLLVTYGADAVKEIAPAVFISQLENEPVLGASKQNSFEADNGRKPLAGVDYDPDAPMCQDDYEYLSGTSA
jgi:transcriptional regulator with XRE-family HTH domain